MWLLMSLVVLILHGCQGAAPRFDPTTLMRLVLVPADATVGSVVYRLRATDEDFDYPLKFYLVDDAAKSIVSVESLPCTKYNSVCQANVVLKRRLEAGRYYDFQVTVRDTNRGTATISCSISATNSTTPKDTIFPHIPSLIMVSEDSKRGTDLDYVVARKNPRFTKPVYMELWGSPLFAIRQRLNSLEETEGTIFLLGPLDYEKQATYHLSVLGNDAYAEPGQDSRNIAGVEIVVVVVDVQDMPPIFTLAPPITRLNNSLLPGDIVVRVHAEDGDKGNPRDIRYGLVSEGNPFTPFFNISETNGDITLARPLDDITAISHVGDPIILTVVAEEVRLRQTEPEAMSSIVQLAFILGERSSQPPYFANDNYVARINENAPQGNTLLFANPYVPEVRDDDMGKNGVFSLTLENNNGTFEISPTVGERHITFLINVRDNTLLDYEATKTVRFKIIAEELGPISNLSSSVDVIVFLNNLNDNAPIFAEKEYFAEFAENATAGTRITKVTAIDPDTTIFGSVRYTQILGHLNTSLDLDPETGIITIATNSHGFDCEVSTEHRMHVEATDANGTGNKAIVPLIIRLIDVNDETPQFERSLYEFILNLNLTNFTFPAYIKAIDNDVSAPNNIVRYELTNGNYENRFILNDITGELILREGPTHSSRNKREAEIYVLTARVYDLGVPHLWSTCQINVYPPESRARTMLFIVAGIHPDHQRTQETLAAITGGKVTIQDIRPYHGEEITATDVTAGDTSIDRSVVVASVTYSKNSVIDISQLQNKLGRNRTVVIGNTYTEDTNKPYRAESNVLFWLLMFLALLIIIALITLILCCICVGCPLYMPPKKRIIRVNSVDDNVHLVIEDNTFAKGNKSIHSTRKEAWSADMADVRSQPTNRQFNKRNKSIKERITLRQGDDVDEILNGRAAVINSNIAYRSRHIDETRSLHDRPHVIYNRELQNRQCKINERDMYIEDYDKGDYNSPTRDMTKRIHVDEDLETESIQRHELERGSDRVYRRTDFGDTGSFRRSFRQQHELYDQSNILNDGREQLFIREGNTEILRLLTRGGQDDERSVTQQQQQQQHRPVTLVQQPQYILVDSGKHLLMERFIEQQLLQQQEIQNSSKQPSNAPSIIIAAQELKQNLTESNQIPTTSLSTKDSELSSSSMPESKQTVYNLINQELLETSLRQQNELLKQILLEKERLEQKQIEMVQREELHFETQSLPGHSVMATQTDCTISTQTDLQYLRPPRRQIRSDNDDSVSDKDVEDDFHLYIVKQSDDVNGIRWIKKRKKYKYRRAKDTDKHEVTQVKRHIKTPILEESESPREPIDKDTEKKVNKDTQNYYKTRTSKLQRKRNEEMIAQDEIRDTEYSRKSPLKKDILLEIAESLEQCDEKDCQRIKINNSDYDTDDFKCELYAVKLVEEFSDDSLNNKINQNNENGSIDLEEKRNIPKTQESSTNSLETIEQKQGQIQSDQKQYSDNEYLINSSNNLQNSELLLKNIPSPKSNSKKAADNKKKVEGTKSTPRYMQWYRNKEEEVQSKKMEIEGNANNINKTIKKIPKNILAPVKSSSIKKNYPTEKKTDVKNITERNVKSIRKENVKIANLSETDVQKNEQISTFHPLMQHSKYRYEHPKSIKQTNLAPISTSTSVEISHPNNVSVKSQHILVKPNDTVMQFKTTEKSQGRAVQPDNSSTSKIDQQLTLKANGVEEDYDSGIAMASLSQDTKKCNQMIEKKSIFTIAYDDVHTKQLRPDSTTPPY